MLFLYIQSTTSLGLSSTPNLFLIFVHQVMQSAGVDGEQVVLLLEDHHLVSADFLETINSLLMSGEVGREIYLVCIQMYVHVCAYTDSQQIIRIRMYGRSLLLPVRKRDCDRLWRAVHKMWDSCPECC